MRVNGAERDFPELSVEDLLSRESFPFKGVAVAINGEIVRRSEWATTIVAIDAVVEILTAAAGG